MDAAVVPDGMVPIHLRETAYTPADAVLVVCEPAFAGVALPDRLSASGVSSHLGKISSIITHSACGVDLSTGIVSLNGTATHTAASGDLLLETWSGTFAGTVLTLDVTFTGGTGRFQNATGWGTLQGNIDPVAGTGYWTLRGRISSPGR
jgi:hypothetical protein